MHTIDNIRNIAIIAHVDHGKTTLVDHILKQTGAFRKNQKVDTRIMDSNDLEKERGITILAKNLSVSYKKHKINIVDTPGHADFGSEVERTLRMVDGVLLLVDAAEGPLPQTKFVLKKSLELGLKPVVVINKIDRKDARADEVLNEIFDLFVALEADDEQLDFPYIYAIAKEGIAKHELEDESNNLAPLLDIIIEKLPAPTGSREKPFQMLISAIDYSDYLGRIAIGKIQNGAVKLGDSVSLLSADGKNIEAKITKLYAFETVNRVEVQEAGAGDIIALTGLEDVNIGDTLADPENTERLPGFKIDEPRISMNFIVNNSPFAGKDGEYVTTRQLGGRLFKELKTNMGLKVEETASADVFKVSGRGELHLSILIENMRREGYELQVSRPSIVTKMIDGEKSEPVEYVVIDVPEEFVGIVIEKLGTRKGEMNNMTTYPDFTRLEFTIPSRGLIGYRPEFLTDTRGTGIMHHNFHGYMPYQGEMKTRQRGALISMDAGTASAYALFKLQERAVFFVAPGTEVYEGMIIGENSRNLDMRVNATKTKQLTNFRASGSDEAIKLAPPKDLTLEQAISWITDDEFVEITPKTFRIRKKHLTELDEKNAKLSKRHGSDSTLFVA